MLRESTIAFGYDFDPASVADPSVATGIPGGRLLGQFVDALFGLPGTSLEVARTGILDELGPAALVDACSVFGNFQMMNRVAEGTGIPRSPQAIEREKDLVEVLGLTIP